MTQITNDSSLGGAFNSDESPIVQTLSNDAAISSSEAQAAKEEAQLAAQAAEVSATNSSSSATASSNSASLSNTAALASQVSASEASGSALSASNSAIAASNSAGSSSSSASNAAASSSNATTKASEALASANSAATSETNAATSETNAATSETNAATSATASASSATASSTSATNAANSATAASTSATNSANSATASATSATEAATSASEAATSATNAATSLAAIGDSETNAANSATAAANSATAASTSETNAANSATASASSATAAQAAEANTILLFDQFGDQYLGSKDSDPTVDNDGDPLTDGDVYFNTTDNVLKFYTGTAWVAPESVASTAATNASNSATAAATSATEALASENAAATSETNAATSESNAATSETNAANSATAASTSETNAASSASSAATSATNAETAYDNFDDRYLGSKASDPTLDNDGDALLTGALYFNTTDNQVKAFDGNGWVEAGSTVNGISDRSIFTATEGQTEFTGIIYDIGFVDVYLNGIKLVESVDFTATTGTSITLTEGATLSDTVETIAYGNFNVANVYTRAESDSRYAQTSTDAEFDNLDVTNSIYTNYLEVTTNPAHFEEGASFGDLAPSTNQGTIRDYYDTPGFFFTNPDGYSIQSRPNKCNAINNYVELVVAFDFIRFVSNSNTARFGGLPFPVDGFSISDNYYGYGILHEMDFGQTSILTRKPVTLVVSTDGYLRIYEEVNGVLEAMSYNDLYETSRIQGVVKYLRT